MMTVLLVFVIHVIPAPHPFLFSFQVCVIAVCFTQPNPHPDHHIFPVSFFFLFKGMKASLLLWVEKQYKLRINKQTRTTRCLSILSLSRHARHWWTEDSVKRYYPCLLLSLALDWQEGLLGLSFTCFVSTFSPFVSLLLSLSVLCILPARCHEITVLLHLCFLFFAVHTCFHCSLDRRKKVKDKMQDKTWRRYNKKKEAGGLKRTLSGHPSLPLDLLRFPSSFYCFSISIWFDIHWGRNLKLYDVSITHFSFHFPSFSWWVF